MMKAWLGAILIAATAPGQAQVQTVDPDVAAQADVERAQSEPFETPPPEPAAGEAPVAPEPSTPASGAAPVPADPAKAYRRDDVISAAEGVFGKGAEGLAGLIEKVLKDQGEPIGYITGREASGAIGIGLRYGSGTLTHKIEGQRPVYWTGPSIGFDVGGDATKVFTLVYNLDDTQELYRRYPQVEGRAYFVGGFSATYLRRGQVVLIPVRAGVGVRLGANVGYMKFSEKSRWLPF